MKKKNSPAAIFKLYLQVYHFFCIQIPLFLGSGIVYKFKCGGCKLSSILKLECVNTSEFLLLLLLERKWKRVMILL